MNDKEILSRVKLVTGELRRAKWVHINFEERWWIIPASEMKMKVDHLVPLCRQAVDLLRKMQQLTGSGTFVFSGRAASRPMSENTVNMALRTIGWGPEKVCAHGFRATARTILDERLNFRVDWIEHQLAHAVKDSNGRAYNRTSFIDGRRDMMQAWADYLDELRGQ